jgi:C-terminal processing protease CtpA/Prc
VKLRDIVYPAIKEMVNQLDPHSHFLTPEEVKKEKEEEKATREYVGVGMIFGSREEKKIPQGKGGIRKQSGRQQPRF